MPPAFDALAGLSDDEQRLARRLFGTAWKKDWRTQWWNFLVEALVEAAKRDPELAKTLCVRIADMVGPDDGLSALVLGRIRTDREGKPRKRRTVWTDGKYFELLIRYYGAVRSGASSTEAADFAAASMGIQNPDEILKKRLAEARRKIADADLPDEIRTLIQRRGKVRTHQVKRNGG